MAESVLRPRLFIQLGSAAFIFIVCWYLFLGGGPYERQALSSSRPTISKPQRPKDLLDCARLPGASDTVVVIKTSAAELEERLPVHLNTTFRCYPNLLIFSDWKEQYQGYEIHDALATVDSQLRDEHPDFELWRRLHDHGSDALEDDEMKRADITSKHLDKWKYLPMFDQTFTLYPNKKWYVFLETDTFIFWSNLLSWLNTLDHKKPHYIGAPKMVWSYFYAPPGSGVVLSHAAMKQFADQYRSNISTWEDFTARQDHGDTMVGRLLRDVGIPVTGAWPIFQSQTPSDMYWSDVKEEKKLWCWPTVSYDGAGPGEIAEMWGFEQQWMKEKVSLQHR